MGYLFTDFPPVLQLHLKRFEYDSMGYNMTKVSTLSYEIFQRSSKCQLLFHDFKILECQVLLFLDVCYFSSIY